MIGESRQICNYPEEYIPNAIDARKVEMYLALRETVALTNEQLNGTFSGTAQECFEKIRENAVKAMEVEYARVFRK